ncbi:MAG TPA: aminotransferase class I/II-fold pyridoxal phosphate-dependent enzyme [Longimicrobiales bacterium]|nr:aminotransferase class I/II-fold pyridoxal phosphate-dependent enzyme [Longimicrobiales bacterium]
MSKAKVSQRLGRLPGYPLAEVPAIRRALEARGVDVIDLGAGDADLAPPPAAVEALRVALDDPAMSRYPFQLGHPPFREAVARWMEKRFGVRVDPFQGLLPLLGSKEGIAHLPLAVLDPGDVAVIPDPGYQAYRGGVVLAGAEAHAVPLRPEHDFLIPLRELPAGIRDRTRMVILNYPNNPTTASAPRAYLEDAVAFCRERGAVLVHDHAYSEVAFDGYRPPSILEIPGAEDVAVEFHSFSKTYNMTGWRLGWAVGNPGLIGALSRVKTFVDTGVFKAVQAGGVGALESYDDWVPGNLEVFRARRDAAVAAFSNAGFEVTAPRATMYLWIPLPPGVDGDAFARTALEEAGVVVLPGSALGAGGTGFFRVALTVPEARLTEAAERLSALPVG